MEIHEYSIVENCLFDALNISIDFSSFEVKVFFSSIGRSGSVPANILDCSFPSRGSLGVPKVVRMVFCRVAKLRMFFFFKFCL